MDVTDTVEKESMRLLSVDETYVRSVYRLFASRFGVFRHIFANSQYFMKLENK